MRYSKNIAEFQQSSIYGGVLGLETGLCSGLIFSTFKVYKNGPECPHIALKMRSNLIGFVASSVANVPLVYLSRIRTYPDKGLFSPEFYGFYGCILTFGICFITSTRFSYNLTRHITTRILHNIVSKQKN